MKFRFVMFNGRRTKLNETEEAHTSIEEAQERAREFCRDIPEVKSVSLWFGKYLFGTHTAKKDMILEAQIETITKEHMLKQADDLLEAMKLE